MLNKCQKTFKHAALNQILIHLNKSNIKKKMKKFITVALIAMGILGLINTSQAQKIGYVSADEIIALMPEAAKVDTQLNEYQQALYQNAQDKQTDI